MGGKVAITQYGFVWWDHTGKVMMTVERACSSDETDKRRWTALRIKTCTEYIDITAMPRKTAVRRTIRPKESKR